MIQIFKIEIIYNLRVIIIYIDMRFASGYNRFSPTKAFSIIIK
jgi:hypothetical protein